MNCLTLEMTCMLPTWAKWLAQDTSGWWYVFRNEPEFNGDYWVVIITGYPEAKKVCEGIPPKDASLELYKISGAK